MEQVCTQITDSFVRKTFLNESGDTFSGGMDFFAEYFHAVQTDSWLDHHELIQSFLSVHNFAFIVKQNNEKIKIKLNFLLLPKVMKNIFM